MSAGVRFEESSWGVRKPRGGLFHVMAVQLVVLEGGIVGWPFGSLASEQ
jgi:hypothetical protein